MNLLVVGDVVGRAGRGALRDILPRLAAERRVDFVVANCENAAGGFGITQEIVREILALGVDAITMGNHMWAKRDVLGIADTEPRLIRPANYPGGAPGVGSGVFAVVAHRSGPQDASVGVINLCGRTFMQPLDCPFRIGDEEVAALRRVTPIIVVDFHAEATSEKQAMGRHLDGRVSIVAGTHTHVQTADETILPGGTAYITDCGMTGATDAIIGMKAEPVLRRFLTAIPVKFEPARGKSRLYGILVDVEPVNGRAQTIERISVPLSSGE